MELDLYLIASCDNNKYALEAGRSISLLDLHRVLEF